MAEDLIRYDLLVQEALKGVVRKVLVDASKHGLEGEHHFYVTFRTDHPGTRISQRLREKYPQEMTIVLQHQFWDMGVTEHTIEVGLSFSGIPERLLVPFDALIGFFDPSVQFGLKFDMQEPDLQESNLDETDITHSGLSNSVSVVPMLPSLEGHLENHDDASKPVPIKKLPKPATKPAAKKAKKTSDESNEQKPETDVEKKDDTQVTPSTAEVVSLDAFRKKN